MIYLENKVAKPSDITVSGQVWVILCKYKDAGWALERDKRIFTESEEALEKMQNMLNEFKHEEMCCRRIDLGNNYKDYFLDSSSERK
jgi:hypothetical protein